MPNVTISLPDHLLERARRYAAQRGTSLNHLLREYLEELVGLNRAQLEESLKRMLELSDKYTGSLVKYKREDLYEDRI